MKVYWLGKQLMNREGTLIDVYAHPRRNEPEWDLMSKDDLKTHNEKIARAAFEAGYDVAHVWPTQMKRNIKDSAWDSFLQSDEYKALVGENPPLGTGDKSLWEDIVEREGKKL